MNALLAILMLGLVATVAVIGYVVSRRLDIWDDLEDRQADCHHEWVTQRVSADTYERETFCRKCGVAHG